MRLKAKTGYSHRWIHNAEVQKREGYGCWHAVASSLGPGWGEGTVFDHARSTQWFATTNADREVDDPTKISFGTLILLQWFGTSL